MLQGRLRTAFWIVPPHMEEVSLRPSRAILARRLPFLGAKRMRNLGDTLGFAASTMAQELDLGWDRT